MKAGYLNEVNRRTQMMGELKNALHCQVAMKDARKARDAMEKRKEAYEVAQKMEVSREIDMINEMQKLRSKSVYRDQLINQCNSKMNPHQGRFNQRSVEAGTGAFSDYPRKRIFGSIGGPEMIYEAPRSDDQRSRYSLDIPDQKPKRFDSFEKPNRVQPNCFQVERPAGVRTQHCFW